MNNNIEKINEKHKIGFNIKPRTIAFLGVYVSLFIIMTFVPQIGFIKVGPINATMMAVPVALVAIHYGWKGAIFGIICFITSSIVSALFYTPPIIGLVGGWSNLMVVYIVGRLSILLPLLVVIGIANIVRKKIKIKNTKKVFFGKYLYAFILGLTISIFNTIFVGTLIYIFMHNAKTFKNTYWIFIATISINIGVEWTIPPIVTMVLSSLGFYLEQKEHAAKNDRY